jgi:hypothetical protein
VAPLDIEIDEGGLLYYNTYGYLQNDGASNTTSGSVFQVSLFASDRVVGAEFDAVSDARIKNVIGASDTTLDLDTLRRLKITNYRYIDVVEKGNQEKKGVIAQEVEKVYPNAVRTTTNFIPSVYAIADTVVYDDATHKLTLTLAKAHGLTVGDVVRIITDSGKVETPVAAVIDEHTFVLSGVEKTSKAFVFGKKVDDFRSVDYDQLFTMNIGATQKLAVDNEALTQENAALTQANAALQSENETVKMRLAALEQAVASMQKQK